MRSRLLPALAALLLVAAAATPARAHVLGASYATVVAAAPDRVEVRLRIRARDLGLALALDRDLDGHLAPAEFERGTPAIRGYLAGHVTLRQGERPVAGRIGALALHDGAALPGGGAPEMVVEATLLFAVAPGAPPALAIDLFREQDPEHACIARIVDATGERGFVFRPDAPCTVACAGATATAARHDGALSFVALGVRHILTGCDHVLLVLALLAAAARARPLFWTLTSFTLGHSLTLALATLGWLAPPAALVEPAIALSVTYVFAQNLVAAPDRARVAVPLLFGLVHGFGFSEVLRGLDLHGAALALGLASFNAGVEAGQLLVVAAAFPALGLLRRHCPGAALWGVRYGASLAGLAVAIVWFAQRV